MNKQIIHFFVFKVIGASSNKSRLVIKFVDKKNKDNNGHLELFIDQDATLDNRDKHHKSFYETAKAMLRQITKKEWLDREVKVVFDQDSYIESEKLILKSRSELTTFLSREEIEIFYKAFKEFEIRTD